MAGKYALYLPYKVLDSLSSGNVTDSEFREFIMGLAEYDRHGLFPASHTAGFTMMFELVKSDLDFAKDKYEAILEKRRNAGKQGGAPKGNKNAVGNRGGAPMGNRNAAKDEAPDKEPEQEKQHNQMLELNDEKTTQAKQAKQAESVVSNQLSVNSHKIKENSSSSYTASGEVAFSKQPPTTTIDIFIKNCKEAGFSLDTKKAREILNTGIDTSWLYGTHNYPEYIANYIRESYPEKSEAEHRRLFVSALTWDDRRAEFPEWRERRIAEAAAQEERRQAEAKAKERYQQIEEARANPPKTCTNCGKPIFLEGRRGDCLSCKWDYFFNEESGKWDANEPMDFSAIRERLRKGRILGETEPAALKAEEIDF